MIPPQILFQYVQISGNVFLLDYDFDWHLCGVYFHNCQFTNVAMTRTELSLTSKEYDALLFVFITLHCHSYYRKINLQFLLGGFCLDISLVEIVENMLVCGFFLLLHMWDDISKVSGINFMFV